MRRIVGEETLDAHDEGTVAMLTPSPLPIKRDRLELSKVRLFRLTAASVYQKKGTKVVVSVCNTKQALFLKNHLLK